MSDPGTAGRLEQVDAMFVQSACGVDCMTDYLVLHGVSPSTVYIGNRPGRPVGHIDTVDFIAEWEAGAGTFAEEPPEAILALLEERIPEAVLRLSHPYLRDGNLSYETHVIEGRLPASAGGCTLFIHRFGQALRPVAVTRVGRGPLRAQRSVEHARVSYDG